MVEEPLGEPQFLQQVASVLLNLYVLADPVLFWEFNDNLEELLQVALSVDIAIDPLDALAEFLQVCYEHEGHSLNAEDVLDPLKEAQGKEWSASVEFVHDKHHSTVSG